ncbi:AlpA family phage regulatory protein [Methylobacterium sp. GC_Met_2]|uniref:helix-turn-helix transcriptional regulator n=1 Tax=Methylobacterium sp. GC_Met_2 TaxID=2937376 RepID=UPI00226B86AA|nr:AlpA family phage regulatory protein [Methylobacterium sp. GC_Met_2]
MSAQAQNITPTGHPGLPASGFVRLSQIIGQGGPIPVSRSTLYAWIQAGLFPSPVRLGPGRIAGFRVEDVRAFIERPGVAPTATDWPPNKSV